MDNQCRQYVSNHKNHQPNTCSAEEFNVHLRLMGDKDFIGLDMFSAIQMNMLKDSKIIIIVQICHDLIIILRHLRETNKNISPH